MSIPPLVCSTPPPPDQCEEDKDPDDFGNHYNLSQDDDVDEIQYKYDDFCTYDVYQTSNIPSGNLINQDKLDPVKSHYDEVPPVLLKDEDNSNCNNEMCGSVVASHIKPRIDEDNNIEDLGLKIDQLSESSKKEIEIVDKINVELDNNTVPNSKSSESAVDTTDILENTRNKIKCDVTEITSPNQENDASNSTTVLEENNVPITEDNLLNQVSEALSSDVPIPTIIDSEAALQFDSFEIVTATDDEFDDFNFTTTVEEVVLSKPDPSLTSKDSPSKVAEPNIGCDDDFDNFQFSNNSNSPVLQVKKDIVFDEINDNPWENKNIKDDFSDFQAKFDDAGASEFQSTSFTNTVQSKGAEVGIKPIKSVGEDDDFGDFDNFQSSAKDNISGDRDSSPDSNKSLGDMSMFTFQTGENESQIYETIERVINSVFEKAISGSERNYEALLEASLCETWGFLTETEIRQPYMINWNNSLGQKTLLRSLCIDSRNILFGPKWNQGMPRYAANLSAAPLQPKKPNATGLAPTALSSDAASSEKPGTMRTLDTWTDTVSSDGQESCGPEDENNPKDRVEPIAGGTDQSKEPSKNYPNSLNIQPLREINLPDTHIFTPTDSEIPRSKTIHNDNSTTATKTSTEATRGQTEVVLADDIQTSLAGEQDNEYSDFQDFKGVTTLSGSNDNTLGVRMANVLINEDPKSNQPITPDKSMPGLQSTITFQTQTILQPVKLEPTIPQLNWPAPGEVKEVFDDFTDFVANSTWFSNENTTTVNTFSSNEDTSARLKPDPVITLNKNIQTNQPKVDDDSNVKQPTPELWVSKSTDEDDNDFTNFQFVPPDPQPSSKPNVNSFVFSGMNENFSKALNTPIAPLTLQTTKLTPPSKTQQDLHILQPTPLDRSSDFKTVTGQILQPLSLESYSQINWPSPGIDLQDLSRFNPIDAVKSLQSDLNVGGHSKLASPVHSQKSQASDEDAWGDFVSSAPGLQNQQQNKLTFVDDSDDWSDFVSSPSIKPQNGLNTISLNVHTNLKAQKTLAQNRSNAESKQADMPSLNYITPKTSNHRVHGDRHFQNL